MAWKNSKLMKFFFGLSSISYSPCIIGFGPTLDNRGKNSVIINADKNDDPKFVSFSLKGKKSRFRWKSFNQDSYFFNYNIDSNPKFIMFGVCDGHGMNGEHVSDHISKELSKYVSLNKSIQLDSDALIQNGIDSVIDSLKNCDIDTSKGGSTLVLSIINRENNIIYTGNIGDSKAAIITGDYDIIDLNELHSPDLPDEINRIYKSGGIITERGYVTHSGTPYGINMTRSLGDDDIHYNNIVSNECDISEYNINNDDICLIIGSDGIWDVMDNDTIISIIKKHHPNIKDAGLEMLQMASKLWMRHGRVDDITFIIYNLK